MSFSSESVLCVEKLKRAWRDFDPDKVDAWIRTRFDESMDACQWLLKWDIPDVLKNSKSAKDDCPERGMGNVKNNLLDCAKEIGGTKYGDQAVESVRRIWNKLCNHQGRRYEFRTMSNAGACSAFEYDVSRNPSQLGLDSWFFSYNYPWHIAGWMQRVYKNEPFKDSDWQAFAERDDQASVKPCGVTRWRFQMKYLWMLANPRTLQVMSLVSFYRLISVFEELDGDFRSEFGIDRDGDGNDREGVWSQDIKDFASKWPELSRRLLSAVLGKDSFGENEDGQAERKKFALMVFAATLADGNSLDLKTMLETGNHAVILYGPPGTGKTFAAQRLVEAELHVGDADARMEPECADAKGVDGKCPFKPLVETKYGWMSLVQFHPNYTYQDFVGGIFPDTKGEKIVYEKRPGIFQEICKKAREACVVKEGKTVSFSKKYFLIVDEINRADLSGVFGELMYGLEYRDCPVNVPLFEPFVVPPNVYIIGTMNNTDKSLIGFDLALRRRFCFMKVMPDMGVLKQTLSLVHEKEDSKFDLGLEFANRAEKLNESLRTPLSEDGLGLSEDKQIGHAYFIKIKDFCEKRKPILDNDQSQSDKNAEGAKGSEVPDKVYVLTRYALEQLWNFHIEPLLEEYLGAEFQDRKPTVDELKKEFCKEFAES